MRYRREDTDGDYTFGQGDSSFLVNSPECVAQAVKTRLLLWRGEWFLDETEGTPYVQSVLGKQPSGAYELAIRDRIEGTLGVKEITAFDAYKDGDTRRVRFNVTLNTVYGEVTVNV
ncbi:hypothetical protein ACQ26G_004197 [Yersinia enterocolitica]|uniref:hypothetical protein n=1 Tax=Yersinia enterocolitica TaxID=630 RepID=UPI0005DD526D|nr:hypothetical protein [Yersinia enterocolitica]CNK98119.1 Uncharacterised protein [Yersinia enterocolitica]